MLEVNGLTKSYGQEEILKGISFSLKPGQTLAVMGPSGCGKSTTIRCLNRLTEPDSGEVIFNGRQLLELSTEELLEVRREIGFVFQDFKLISRLTVLENLMLVLFNSKLAREEVKERALETLNRVGLKEKQTAYPENLSGGQKQRVGIARALVAKPKLVLLDEPTASLDPILVGEVLEVIRELTAESSRGVILVTHEINFALQVADRVLLLNKGQIVESGPSRRILTQPKSELGRKYKEFLNFY